MKKLSFFLFTFIVICLTGCKKEYILEAASPEISGDLEGAFTLVEEKYPMTVSEDGKTLSVTIKVKRTNISLPIVSDKTGAICETPTDDILAQASFGLVFTDADGKEILTMSPKETKDCAKQQMSLLRLSPESTGELTVTIPFDKERIPAKVALTSELKFIGTQEIAFEGAIGKYGVKNFSIAFNFVEEAAKGKYQYTTSPAGAYLYLSGNIDEFKKEKDGEYVWTVSITEDNGQGMTSGELEGKLTLKRDSKTSPYYYTITGNFRNYRNDNFQCNLKTAPLADLYKVRSSSAVNVSNSEGENTSYNEESEYDEEDGASKNGENWDEVLTSYDSYVTKYISLMKKASKGDSDALSEYPALLSEAQELGDKLENAKGEMTSAQLARYTKITNRLSQAAANMR